MRLHLNSCGFAIAMEIPRRISTHLFHKSFIRLRIWHRTEAQIAGKCNHFQQAKATKVQCCIALKNDDNNRDRSFFSDAYREKVASTFWNAPDQGDSPCANCSPPPLCSRSSCWGLPARLNRGRNAPGASSTEK